MSPANGNAPWWYGQLYERQRVLVAGGQLQLALVLGEELAAEHGRRLQLPVTHQLPHEVHQAAQQVRAHLQQAER